MPELRSGLLWRMDARTPEAAAAEWAQIKSRFRERFGTEPVGETCRTCGHLVRKTWNRVYLKCDLWDSNGPASDIRLKWPACRRWEP